MNEDIESLIKNYIQNNLTIDMDGYVSDFSNNIRVRLLLGVEEISCAEMYVHPDNVSTRNKEGDGWET